MEMRDAQYHIVRPFFRLSVSLSIRPSVPLNLFINVFMVTRHSVSVFVTQLSNFGEKYFTTRESEIIQLWFSVCMLTTLFATIST